MTLTTEGRPAGCATCGRPLRPGARFCTGCGAPVASVLVIAPEPAGTGSDRGRRAAGARQGGRGAGPATPTSLATAGGGEVAMLDPAFDGVRPAPVGRRLLAYLVDAACLAALVGALAIASGSPALAALVGVEVTVGLVVWEARTGRTPGNLVCGLRTARLESPYATGARRALPRALVLGAGHLVAGLGQWVVLASAAFDPSGRRQGWHDKAGRAVVVDVRGPRLPQVAAAPVARRVTPVPAGAPAPAPVVPAPAPVVPAAVATPVLAAPVLAVPVVVPPAVPVVAAGTGRFVLTLDSGEVSVVHGPGLIGRAPRPRPGERCDHLVTVDDPQRSLSRTHARFGVDDGVFWVADAGSGNGTVVVAPDGTSVRAGSDRPVRVADGSTVQIGDRTFTVRDQR